MPTQINDSGTWRSVRQVQINDGGVWRTIRSIEVNSGGVWRTVFLYELLSTTMTEGIGGPGSALFGYSDPSIYSIGSVGSTAVEGGYTLTSLVDFNDGFTTYAELAISGFGSDPGAAFFDSITVGGSNKASVTASYSYVAGTATWTWGSSTFGLDGSGSSAVVIYY